ncbi:MAG: hypothetical protein KDD56_09610 [Bdellovibrionales bacterium]|nr:hypothetical protein [Bdellovibrionales bacterium]
MMQRKFSEGVPVAPELDEHGQPQNTWADDLSLAVKKDYPSLAVITVGRQDIANLCKVRLEAAKGLDQKVDVLNLLPGQPTDKLSEAVASAKSSGREVFLILDYRLKESLFSKAAKFSAEHGIKGIVLIASSADISFIENYEVAGKPTWFTPRIVKGKDVSSVASETIAQLRNQQVIPKN